MSLNYGELMIRMQERTMTSKKINVVIFGESGSGKSSVINMLMGRKCADTSDTAIGCTFQSKSYTSGEFIFHDTVGLSEGSRGTMTSKKAISGLVKLLRALEDGVSLLVFVFEKGRIKKTLEENYKLFVDTICMKKVPVIAVVTHCEQEKEMGDWWVANKKYFDDYGMKFADTTSGCATMGENLNPLIAGMMKSLFEGTQKKLKESIEKHSLAEPWKMESLISWLGIIWKKSLNAVLGFFSLPSIPFWPELKRIFMELGDDENTATVKSNELAEQIRASE